MTKASRRHQLQPAALPPDLGIPDRMTHDGAAHRLRMIAADIDRLAVAYGSSLARADLLCLQDAREMILGVERHVSDVVEGRGEG